MIFLSEYERTTANILGSGADRFAVIRLEVINPGSYYSWEEKTHLDEYKKGAEGRELIKSTLLIHATFSFPDADTRLPVERKVVTQDSTLKMGEVIDKYPMNTDPEWNRKEVEQLKFVENAGLIFEGFGVIISDEHLEKKFGESGVLKRNAIEWSYLIPVLPSETRNTSGGRVN